MHKLLSKRSLASKAEAIDLRMFDEDFDDIRRYGRGESWIKTLGESRFVFDFSQAASAVLGCAAKLTYTAILPLLREQTDWRPQWERFVAYQCVGYVLRLRWAAWRISDARAKQELGKPYFGSSFKDAAPVIANCLVLGWTERATEFARRVRNALAQGMFDDGSCNETFNRTQHFVIRLVSDWQGWAEVVPPEPLPCAYDEQIFNDLLAHWRTQDVNVIRILLQRALQRHVEQTRWNKDGVYFDCNVFSAIYNPYEVLAVLRLRQLQGLPNPDLSEHPLMDTLLSRELLAPSAPYTDELL
jgi:hypothetical protein